MFSRFFIYRPVFALVIAIVIVILGVISLPTLPVESMPDITPPTVSITTTFPGASAVVVEQTVTTPIEKEVNGVENMIYMQSKSTSAGTMDLTVSFEIGTDPDMAAVLTQNRVSIAEPLLPEDVKRQGVKTEKQSTQLTLMVNLISPDGRYDDVFISNYATTQINDVLARVEGVGKVTAMGAKDYGMRIWIDPGKLKARGLTTDEVVGALREQNVQVAAGKIGQPPNPAGLNFEYTISTLGRLETVGQFEDIIVKTGQAGEIVRIRDVARVELGAQDYSWYVQLDGAPSVGIAIYQLPGSNALGVAQGVEEALAELEQNFPEGLEAVIAYDSTRYIEASIDEVISTLIIAILLVIFSVFIFLQDWRTTVIPSVTIPVSLIGTFFAMKMFGMSINNLTLFGVVLAIGIVVDDAIVVVENTMRLIDEEGMEAKAATAKAMEEVGGAIVATTLVLLAVFVPTMMMPGLTGRLYQQFAITISIATVFSSINALTLSPALAGMLLRPSPEKRNLFFTKFNDWFDTATGKYMGAVKYLVRRTGLVMVVFAGLMVAMFLSFTMIPGGFIPDEDQGYFFVNLELPDGASMERTGEVLDRINLVLENTPGMQNYITIGGYSFLNGVQGSNYGAVIATLDEWSERSKEEHVEALMADIQRYLFSLQEGTAFAFGPPAITGLGNATGFALELQDRGGVGLQQLETFARDMVVAGNESPVVTRLNQNFTANVPQLFVDVDRNRVKTYGVPLQSVFNTLQANLGSMYVNDFNIFGRTWKVQVQADQQFRSRISDIDRLEVRNANGDMVPMGFPGPGAGHGGPAGHHAVQHVPSVYDHGSPGARAVVRAGCDRDAKAGRPGAAAADGLPVVRRHVSADRGRKPGTDHLQPGDPLRVPVHGGAVRELDDPARRADGRADGDPGRTAVHRHAQPGQQHLHADRSGSADRTFGQDGHSDRGVRQAATGRRKGLRRGGGYGGAPAVPTDPDDGHLVHPRRDPAGGRLGCGSGEPGLAGDGRPRRHVDRDGERRVHDPRVLRDGPGHDRTIRGEEGSEGR